MVLEFVNRVAEIKALEDCLAEPKPGLIRVYGRRRLGKTELLRRVVERRSGLYLLVEDADRPLVLASLAQQVARATGGLAVPFRDWRTFYQALPGLGFPFVVLDEFQNIIANDRQAVSQLQGEWDTTLRKTGPSIILCGSSVGMMQRITSRRPGPLFGRLSADLRLKPLSYGAVRLLYPRDSEEEKIRRFSVFGGTPFYHGHSVGRTLEQAVRRSFLDAPAPFQEEPQTLLRLELKAPVRYNSILYEIGQGTHQLRELESKVGVKAGGLGPYLDLLKSDLDLVRMEDPVCGVKRTARYVFSDPFFSFYYRFVFANRPRLELGRGAEVWQDIQAGLDAYVGLRFEAVATDLLTILNGRTWKGISIGFDQIGRWWNRVGDEIDIVAPGPKEVLVGEVKWSAKGVEPDLLETLLRKADRIERTDGRPVRPMVVTRGPISDAATTWLKEHHGMAFTLSDLTSAYQGLFPASA